MKGKLYIILLALGFFVNTGIQSKAQFLDDEFCGNNEVLNLDVRKKPWKGANSFLYDYLKKINYSDNIDSVRYLVPLKFWIYQNDDGSVGLPDSTLKRFMDELNYYQQLNKTGFRYYIRDVERINKTKRIKLGYFLEAPWQSIVHKDKGCINIFVTQTIKKRVWGEKYMVRGTFNTLTNAVLIQYNSSTTGLSHEIGHYFGLLHPHRNYNKGKAKQESVSRTRAFKGIFKKGLICEKNGDGLADTPAEPKLSHLVNNDCEFVGKSLKDRWGDNYQSKTDNIMSYPTHYRCRKVFTEGQKAIMLYSASQNKYAPFWTTSKPENMVYRFDKYEPDNNKETATIIDINTVQQHSFHKIFIPENNKHVFDKEDWLTFQTENTKGKTINITLNCQNTENKQISIVIFDEYMHLLKEKEVSQNQTTINLTVKANVKNQYFILIKSNKSPVNQAFTYQISVQIL